MSGWSINPFWEDEIETFVDEPAASASSSSQQPAPLPTASKKVPEKKKATAADSSKKRTTSATKKQKTPAAARPPAASAASDGSDSEADAFPSTQPPLKRSRPIQFESEDEVQLDKGSKAARAAILRSFLTQRGASGFTTQRDPAKIGEYFVELRVYNSREAERVPADQRWKHALTSLKVATDIGTPVWRAVSKLVQTGFLNVITQIRCQYPVLHPVTFTQSQGEWHNPHQPRNPPWQFSAPRKRSPDSMQIHYSQPTSYNQSPFGSRPDQGQNYESFVDPSYQGPQIYQSRSSSDLNHSETRNNPNGGRLLSDSAFTRISETLGAINTVGHYLVDMVNEEEKDETDSNLKQLPQALYTLSKNVLGRNVTDKIAPIVKKALPRVLPDAPITKIATGDVQDSKGCTTPDGEAGICEDLSNCPQLLLNLISLRESLCFKDLFVPGVCCPKNAVATTPVAETPVLATTSKPTYLVPVTTQRPQSKPTTKRPTTTKKPSAVLVLTTKRPRPVTTSKPITSVATVTTTHAPQSTTFETVPPPVITNFSNIIDVNECGQREDEGGRIVGGTESESGAWPWMVAIYLHGSKRREFWCGGTLVGPRHVLTAAHCTRDSKQRPFPPRQFSVRVGDVDLSREDEPARAATVRVAAVRAHDQFSRVGYYNDIAVLVLAENVRKSKYVIPICLPPDASRRFEGALATVAGWGTTRYGGAESARQRHARLPVWRNQDCDRAYFQPITDAFLCAGYTRGGVDACQGDSGGPLMLQIAGRWTQIGVVSFGNKCGEPGYPGVYTRLTHYADWLRQNLV